MKIIIYFYMVVSLAIQPASAYEITTHALITQKAYERSALNPSNPNSVVTAIGFDRLGQNTAFDLEQKINAGLFSTPVDRAYYDDAVRPATINQSVVRLPQQQEKTSMQWLLERGFTPGFSSVESFEGSIPGWLMRGSIREDDNDGRLILKAWATGDDRDLDPYGRILRAVKHLVLRALPWDFLHGFSK